MITLSMLPIICAIMVAAAVCINAHTIDEYRALKKLLKMYKKYQHKCKYVRDVHNLQRNYKCPLCAANRASWNCSTCVWVRKTGHDCRWHSYSRMLVPDRIAQIEEWMASFE